MRSCLICILDMRLKIIDFNLQVHLPKAWELKIIHKENYRKSVSSEVVLPPGIILCMCPANERQCYNVTSSLIGWAHIWNNPWLPQLLWGILLHGFRHFCWNESEVIPDQGPIFSSQTFFSSCLSVSLIFLVAAVNTLRTEQHGWHFADNIFKYISLNEGILN